MSSDLTPEQRNQLLRDFINEAETIYSILGFIVGVIVGALIGILIVRVL
jgi:uncharacterized membrane protein YoaK (UPF0700 family)